MGFVKVSVKYEFQVFRGHFLETIEYKRLIKQVESGGKYTMKNC
jgi:hypothetical protein